MNVHESNARRLADLGGPMGALCAGLLELLDEARGDSIWAQAVAEYAAERVTLGGIPHHFPQNPDITEAWANVTSRGGVL